jgi:hypothetical protein
VVMDMARSGWASRSIDTSVTNSRRMVGSPPVSLISRTAQPLEHPDQPHDLLEREDLPARQPRESLGRHAVRAPEVCSGR